jgi:hypothetical protein
VFIKQLFTSDRYASCPCDGRCNDVFGSDDRARQPRTPTYPPCSSPMQAISVLPPRLRLQQAVPAERVAHRCSALRPGPHVPAGHRRGTEGMQSIWQLAATSTLLHPALVYLSERRCHVQLNVLRACPVHESPQLSCRGHCSLAVQTALVSVEM